MDLKSLKDIKISEIIEIGEILDLPLKKAIPEMKAICNRHGFDWASEGRTLCRIAQILNEA